MHLRVSLLPNVNPGVGPVLRFGASSQSHISGITGLVRRYCPGLSACSGSAFTEAQDCNPAQGTCTLMQTNDLALGAPQRRSPGIFG